MARCSLDRVTLQVHLSRDSASGSLGIELDEYQERAVISDISVDGPADKEGILEIGDVIIAINDTPVADVNEVAMAVIASTTATLKIKVMREPKVELHSSLCRGRLMKRGETEGTPFNEYAISLFSNREFVFEQQSPPFGDGAISLPELDKLLLVRVNGALTALQIASHDQRGDDIVFEFYCSTLPDLYDWMEWLQAPIASSALPVQGWMTVYSSTKPEVARYYVILEPESDDSDATLAYYSASDPNTQLLRCGFNLSPAHGVMSLIDMAEAPELISGSLIKQRLKDFGAATNTHEKVRRLSV